MHSLSYVREMSNAARAIAHLCDGDPRDDERKRYSSRIPITHIERSRVSSRSLLEKRKSGCRCVVKKLARFACRFNMPLQLIRGADAGIVGWEILDISRHQKHCVYLRCCPDNRIG